MGRQAPVRGEVIDSVGQVVREFRQQLLPRQARLLLQFVDRVWSEGMGEFVRGKPPVLPCANPGIGMVAVAVLPKLIEQATQTTASGTATPAKQAAQQAAQSAWQRATKATRHSAAEPSAPAKHAPEATSK